MIMPKARDSVNFLRANNIALSRKKRLFRVMSPKMLGRVGPFFPFLTKNIRKSLDSLPHERVALSKTKAYVSWNLLLKVEKTLRGKR